MASPWRTVRVRMALALGISAGSIYGDPLPIRVPLATRVLQIEAIDPEIQVRLEQGGRAVVVGLPSSKDEALISVSEATLLLRQGEFQASSDSLSIEREGRVVARLKLLPKEAPLPQPAAFEFRDSFDGAYLPKWKIINSDPEKVSLKKSPGALTITTQQGGLWSSFNNAKNLFVIENRLAERDFVITTELVGFDPQADYNQAGLLCYDDMDNYLVFSLQWDRGQGGRTLCQWAETEGRPIEPQQYRRVDAMERVWLRVAKEGQRYTASFSRDGQTYEAIGTTQWKGSPSWVGLVAKNGGPGRGPQLDASFESFELRAAEAAPQVAATPTSSSAAEARLVDGALFVMNVDGTGLRRVASLRDLSQIGSPAWSPDGTQLAFDAHGPGFARQHVFLVDLDGEGVKNVGAGGFPSWCRSTIAYHNPSASSVLTVNLENGTRGALSPAPLSHPRYSPDCRRIAVLREYRRLEILDLADKQGRFLFDREAPEQHWGCAWSPDGKRIALTRGSSDGSMLDELIVVDADAEGAQQEPKILHRGNLSTHVSWSPDGKSLLAGVYAPNEGPRHLWTFSVDEERPPAEIPGQSAEWDYCDGAWSPDGQTIAFSVRDRALRDAPPDNVVPWPTQ